MLIGILVYSYYTSLGFLLAAKMVRLTYRLSKSSIVLDPWDPDGNGGFAFVGRHVQSASLSFASGMLFLPILLYVNHAFVYENAYIIYSYASAYSIAILACVVIPIYFIHQAIDRQKKIQLRRIQRVLNRLAPQIPGGGSFANYAEYRLAHDLYNHTKDISEWPFRLQEVLPAAGFAISGIATTVATLIRNLR